MSMDQKSEVLQFAFIVCQVEDYRNILKLSCRQIAFISYKAILKNKKWSGTSLPASFSAWFSRRYISLGIFYYLAKFDCLDAFTSRDIGQYVYCNCLLNQDKKSRQKFKYLENKKIF